MRVEREKGLEDGRVLYPLSAASPALAAGRDPSLVGWGRVRGERPRSI